MQRLMTTRIAMGAAALVAAATAAAGAVQQPGAPAPLEEVGRPAPPPLTAFDPAELLRSDPMESELAPPSYPDAVRVRRVRIERSTLERLQATGAPGFPGGALTVELFPGERHVLDTPLRWARHGERAFSASGTLAGDPSAYWSLAVRGSVVLLNLRPGDGRVHGLRVGADGHPLAVEVQPAPGGRCGNELVSLDPSAHPDARRRSGEPLGTPQGGTLTELQLLVAITPAAVFDLGGGLAARAAVELAVEEGNMIFLNSEVDCEWKLEAVAQVRYDESSSTFPTHLNRLTNAGDGFMDEVHEWRGVVHADFVQLVLDDIDVSGSISTLGLAWVQPPPPSPWPGPFGVTEWGAMLSGMTLTHELGHSMGIGHDLGASPGLTVINQDAYGWLFNGSTQGSLRTVMGTGFATRIPFFSNPTVKFDGQATGQESNIFTIGADAAFAMNSFRNVYALLGASAIPSDLTDSFCNFGAGPLQLGAFNTPFDLLMESVLQVQPSGGNVWVGGGGATSERPLLWFERRFAPGGSWPDPWRIGQ